MKRRNNKFMNWNFKIVFVSLLISAVILIGLRYFITDKSLKAVFLNLGIGLLTSSIIEILLFFINPKWFKNKVGKFNS